MSLRWMFLDPAETFVEKQKQKESPNVEFSGSGVKYLCKIVCNIAHTERIYHFKGQECLEF